MKCNNLILENTQILEMPVFLTKSSQGDKQTVLILKLYKNDDSYHIYPILLS